MIESIPCCSWLSLTTRSFLILQHLHWNIYFKHSWSCSIYTEIYILNILDNEAFILKYIYNKHSWSCSIYTEIYILNILDLATFILKYIYNKHSWSCSIHVVNTHSIISSQTYLSRYNPSAIKLNQDWIPGSKCHAWTQA